MGDERRPRQHSLLVADRPRSSREGGAVRSVQVLLGAMNRRDYDMLMRDVDGVVASIPRPVVSTSSDKAPPGNGRGPARVFRPAGHRCTRPLVIAGIAWPSM